MRIYLFAIALFAIFASAFYGLIVAVDFVWDLLVPAAAQSILNGISIAVFVGIMTLAIANKIAYR